MQQKKYIVTHANPDLDAVSAVWLIKRFWNGWETAETLFVPAGETISSFRKKSVDTYKYIGDFDDAEVVHVDTGLGFLDHHQDNTDTCAARLVFETLIAAQQEQADGGTYRTDDGIMIQPRHFQETVLKRMAHQINAIDHFQQVYFPDSLDDRYQFMLVDILDGLNLLYNTSGTGDLQVLSHGMMALDAIYRVLQNKIGAEQELEGSEKKVVVTKYGEAAGFETGNDAVLDIAQKQGYVIVARKDKRKGYVRIKSLPGKGIDLSPVYETLKQKDPNATWFLHASHGMLLNGSTKNPSMKPTTLSLEDMMTVIGQSFH